MTTKYNEKEEDPNRIIAKIEINIIYNRDLNKTEMYCDSHIESGLMETISYMDDYERQHLRKLFRKSLRYLQETYSYPVTGKSNFGLISPYDRDEHLRDEHHE